MIPKGYVYRNSWTLASTEMLQLLLETSTSPDVIKKATEELSRRDQLIKGEGVPMTSIKESTLMDVYATINRLYNPTLRNLCRAMPDVSYAHLARCTAELQRRG